MKIIITSGKESVGEIVEHDAGFQVVTLKKVDLKTLDQAYEMLQIRKREKLVLNLDAPLTSEEREGILNHKLLKYEDLIVSTKDEKLTENLNGIAKKVTKTLTYAVGYANSN